MTDRARIAEWASRLTNDESFELIIELMEELLISGVIRFPKEALAPYYEASGEPLVLGQVPFKED